MTDLPPVEFIRKNIYFLPANQSHLASLMSDQKLGSEKTNSVGRTVHEILSIYKNATAYYNSSKDQPRYMMCTEQIFEQTRFPLIVNSENSFNFNL